MDVHYEKIEQIVAQNVEASQRKAKNKLTRVAVYGIIAGFFVALGAQASNVAIHNISNVGVARVVAGAVFPVGLMMIIILGGELFTSDCLISMAVYSRKVSAVHFIKMIIIVYLSNFAGACLLAWMINHSGQLDYSGGMAGAYTIKAAFGKVSVAPFQALISGILCNILVCLATFMAGSAKDIAGKCLAIFFPIMVFVVSGFEHCIANMYYVSAGIFAAGNQAYAQNAMELFHLSADQVAAVSWSGLVRNLIPVTIGNALGGIFVIGFTYWYLYERRSS